MTTPVERVAEFVRQAMLLPDANRHEFHNVHSDPNAEMVSLSLYDLAELVTDAKPEMITTREQLEALPAGVMFISEQGGVWETINKKGLIHKFREVNKGGSVQPKYIALPARVIDRSGVTE